MDKVFSGFEGFIERDEMSKDQVIIIKWQYNYFGSFYHKLIEAARRADAENKGKLKLAFPEIMQALERYDTEEGFFEEVERLAESKNIRSRGA